MRALTRERVRLRRVVTKFGLRWLARSRAAKLARTTTASTAIDDERATLAKHPHSVPLESADWRDDSVCGEGEGELGLTLPGSVPPSPPPSSRCHLPPADHSSTTTAPPEPSTAQRQGSGQSVQGSKQTRTAVAMTTLPLHAIAGAAADVDRLISHFMADESESAEGRLLSARAVDDAVAMVDSFLNEISPREDGLPPARHVRAAAVAPSTGRYAALSHDSHGLAAAVDDGVVLAGNSDTAATASSAVVSVHRGRSGRRASTGVQANTRVAPVLDSDGGGVSRRNALFAPAPSPRTALRDVALGPRNGTVHAWGSPTGRRSESGGDAVAGAAADNPSESNRSGRQDVRLVQWSQRSSARVVADRVVTALPWLRAVMTATVWLREAVEATAAYALLARLLTRASKRCMVVVSSRGYDRFVVACITANAVCIGMERYDLPPPQALVQGALELVFGLVFTAGTPTAGVKFSLSSYGARTLLAACSSRVGDALAMRVLTVFWCLRVIYLCVAAEMVMKLLAYKGFKGYLSSVPNLFDCILVLATFPALIAPAITGSFSNSSSFSALAAFRVFRVFRIARLLHKVPAMRQLLTTVFSSISGVVYLFVFAGVTLATGAIMFTALFARPYPPSPDVAQALNDGGYSMYAGGDVPSFNFDTFMNSFLSMFLLATGTCQLVSVLCCFPSRVLTTPFACRQQVCGGGVVFAVARS